MGELNRAKTGRTLECSERIAQLYLSLLTGKRFYEREILVRMLVGKDGESVRLK